MRRSAAIIAVTTTSLLLGACATGPSGRYEPSAVPVGAGGSWAAALPAPVVDASDAYGVTSRRDADLRPREHRLATALDEWPRPARPDLSRDRFFRTSNPYSNGFIYYEADERRSRGYRHRGWYPHR